ncbi:hypothetical protein [Caulobacter sp. S45]|uniref:hypothetical protein n=1 Tax=Caulobacter sp. S45 TaxID=1641861 RepID=UPI00131C3AB7|nr:hypothetical protein [Caulobacter sp. S45]
MTVTLSANTQRLQTAEANLASDEAGASTGALASQWDQDLANTVDSSSEAAADAEVAALPSSDPDHIAQATSAQAYIKAKMASAGNPVSVANPFAGLSQSALAAIANDKSGLYTSYEKSAAVDESMDQTTAWVMKYASDTQGQEAGFFQAAQQQYSQLSPLQQSVYPADYMKALKQLENEQSNAVKTPDIAGDASNPKKADAKVAAPATASDAAQADTASNGGPASSISASNPDDPTDPNGSTAADILTITAALALPPGDILNLVA